MTRPWGRVSRRTYWRREIRLAKTPEERLERSFNFVRAMAAAVKATRPASVKEVLEEAAKALEEQAEKLAALARPEDLERGGARR